MNEEFKHLGRALSKKEQKKIRGGEDFESIGCKTPCTCKDGTHIMCDCGYENKCISKKCAGGEGLCVG